MSNNNPHIGTAQPVTDTVKRAMEFLKDRPMPQARADMRQNFRRGRPAAKEADASPAPGAGDQDTNDNAEQQADRGD